MRESLHDFTSKSLLNARLTIHASLVMNGDMSSQSQDQQGLRTIQSPLAIAALRVL
jgi:hypothetical protein